ncbi:MAG TPA: ABC transporter ATP-binding protein [Steroidobacteraceae bacterium]|nr:ABC transporter ATP-binding protein [Steroidobacteraceae bacterium]
MSAAPEPARPPALHADSLQVCYAQGAATLAAVRDVSFRVSEHERVGIVGESGAGKSQAFLAVMGLLPKYARISGSVRFEGREILGLEPRALNRVRGSRLTMIFQDPMSSLTPHMKIGAQLAEVLVHHAGLTWRAAQLAALEMLDRVRIPDARRRLRQYPHELSGGMRQRVMIGMSLLCDPALLIADEPTSALDVTVQAQIIELLRALHAQSRMSIVLISHDMGVVAAIAQRILVMYAGRIVESAPAGKLLRQARHPYSALLIRCVPSLREPRGERMACLPGQAPGAADLERGCAFAPRCPRASARCHEERPPLRALEADAQVACHHPLEP